jgi:hypothetical protein
VEAGSNAEISGHFIPPMGRIANLMKSRRERSVEC